MKGKAELTEEQKKVMFEGATETPFTGHLLHNHEGGDYMCANCGAKLFDSDTKFESGSGWPSFNNPANTQAIKLKEDNSHDAQRVEVTCADCGIHLGHVFNDAPDQPTGMRFCINSCTLEFKPEAKK